MLPLDDLRVLDLSRAVPGPYCSMLLGDMGADVLLVEPIGEHDARLDPERNALRRNKRSICVNLKHPEGQGIARRLASESDVFLEGFRPGVVQRLGVDYATLLRESDRIVYCSLSGYGQDGPYATMPGHDINYIAIAGALSTIGRAGTLPAIPMNLIADLAGGGLMAAFAILVALHARQRTGKGQYIDLAMTDGVLSLLTRASNQMLEQGGAAPEPGNNRLTGALPHYDVYACKDGRALAVGPLEGKFHENLCDAVGAPELADIGEDAPHEARERARARFRDIFATRTRDEWFALLRSKQACVTPVYALDEAFADEHHRARGMVVDVEHVGHGPLRQIGIAPKLGTTPGRVRHAGPAPGAHTEHVLAELGYSSADVARLMADHVVA